MKVSLGWGTIFGLGFTRGLYNTPGFEKQKYPARPDFRTMSNGSYRDNDWVSQSALDKWCPKKDYIYA